MVILKGTVRCLRSRSSIHKDDVIYYVNVNVIVRACGLHYENTIIIKWKCLLSACSTLAAVIERFCVLRKFVTIKQRWHFYKAE